MDVGTAGAALAPTSGLSSSYYTPGGSSYYPGGLLGREGVSSAYSRAGTTGHQWSMGAGAGGRYPSAASLSTGLATNAIFSV